MKPPTRATKHRELLQFARDVAGCMTSIERANFTGMVTQPDVDLMITTARRLVHDNTPIDAAAIVRKDRRS